MLKLDLCHISRKDLDQNCMVLLDTFHQFINKAKTAENHQFLKSSKFKCEIIMT
jgi:hypothetical protein